VDTIGLIGWYESVIIEKVYFAALKWTLLRLNSVCRVMAYIVVSLTGGGKTATVAWELK